MDEAVLKRVLPHSTEAERSVIGSMIMDRDAVLAASEILEPEDFYQSQYGVLFSAMVELLNEGKPVDLVTLQDCLKAKDLPEELSSLEYIRDLVAAVPTSTHARHYAGIVKEKAILRKLIKVTEGIAGDCYLGKEPVDVILEETERKVFDLVQNRISSDFVSIDKIVLQSLESIEAASKKKGAVTGLATGFYDLDYRTSGLQRSDLILVAARPSMGKTAFALNIAEHVAVRSNTPTAIFSLEMSRDQLAKRMLSMNGRVDSQAIRSGDLRDEDWVRLVESVKAIGSSGLIIDDTPGISVSELRSKCRKYKLDYGVGLVVVDYLQLLTLSRRSESRQQEVSEISRSLKSLAREIDTPVIALSQLSRAVEQRPDKRPMLSDLRDSGAIEQDADVVMFLYRDEYYNPETEDAGVAEVIIGKQRNGPTGTVRLGWQAPYTKFVNLQRE